MHYEFHYRDQIPMHKWDEQKNTIADVAMGIVLAFVLYKCYDEPEHLLVCLFNMIHYVLNS